MQLVFAMRLLLCQAWTHRNHRPQNMAEPRDPQDFDLEHFLPYLLNQAAEATSQAFHATYKSSYGLTRTQWRVLANIGKFGAMTARDICAISHIEKTKVSRSVAALESDGLVSRQNSPSDRRTEILSLTPKGRQIFDELGQRAIAYDKALRDWLGGQAVAELDEHLRRLIGKHDPAAGL